MSKRAKIIIGIVVVIFVVVVLWLKKKNSEEPETFKTEKAYIKINNQSFRIT